MEKLTEAEIHKELDRILAKPMTLGSEREALRLLKMLGVTKCPDGVRHRKGDPDTVAEMRKGQSA